jgi:hypothetical protein
LPAAVHVTVSFVLVPSGGAATEVIDGVFRADEAEAVVSVLVADHALVPALLALWICTSIAAPAARPDRSYGLVTFDTVVQVLAPEGLDCRSNAVAALCELSTAGGVQVTVRSLPEPGARDAACGVLGSSVVWVGIGDGVAAGVVGRGTITA